jgi:methionyl aminopeptidase
MSLIKTKEEIELMRESCKITADVLKYIRDFIKPGAKTRDLDELIEDFILSRGAYPAFKGYGPKKNKFPASSCISLNEVVVHGIPGERELVVGDVVSIDVGVKKNGFFGDSAFTFGVGDVSPKKERLMKITKEALYKGIEKAVADNTLNDIACAIQNYVEGSGYGVVRALCGHGIGKNLHEEPAVLNYYSSKNNMKLRSGMILAIEPMVNYGTYEVVTLKDGWTTVTKDNEPSAHYEHTVLITGTKPEILTF